MSQSAKKSGLGKGLSALMGDSYSVEEETPSAKNTEAGQGTGQQELSLNALKAGKYQPRRHFDDEYLHELADSIEKNGIMQPIVVRSLTSETYEIIAGERRFRAAQLAGLKTVPVIIRDDVKDQQALELALIENIQRKDLSAIEEAEGYQQLIKEFDYSQEQLAKTVGKSRSHITNLLRLLKLPDALKKLVLKGSLSMGHARALIGVADAEKIAEKAIKEGLSVRQVEALANPKPTDAEPKPAKSEAKPKPKHTGNKDADVLALEESLSQNLGLPVSIEDLGNQSGEITLRYNSLLQLDNILQKLNSDTNF